MHPPHGDWPREVEVREVGVREVEVTEAARLTDADIALLLDVREDDEWAAAHCLAALHIPLGDLPHSRLPSDRPVLVICRSGNRSATAAALLVARGFDARNVVGGIQAWQTAGLPIVAGGRPPDAPE